MSWREGVLEDQLDIAKEYSRKLEKTTEKMEEMQSEIEALERANASLHKHSKMLEDRCGFWENPMGKAVTHWQIMAAYEQGYLDGRESTTHFAIRRSQQEVMDIVLGRINPQNPQTQTGRTFR